MIVTRSDRMPDPRERLDAWPVGTYRQLRGQEAVATAPQPVTHPYAGDRGPDRFDEAMARYLEGYSECAPDPADF